MPLYEYKCRKCSKRFEFLVMGSDQPCCPKCNGRDLERLFSTFAVSGAVRKSESDSFGDVGGGDLGGSDFDGGDFGGGGPGGGFDPGASADDMGGDLGGDLGGMDSAGDLGGDDLGGAGDDSAGSGSWDDD
jgi:putative FmdB family regulatory protein